MKTLDGHRHIVRFVEFYACGLDLGIILDPPADGGSMALFLYEIEHDARRPDEADLSILEQAFGCLASALAFIHKKTIRHKDIKTDNLLVHKGKIMLTDFGIAFASGEADMTTSGIATMCTRRYCAPEVVNDGMKRNEKSDVFSMGVVFVEILSRIEPTILSNALLRPCYSDNINPITEALEGISYTRHDVVRACNMALKLDSHTRSAATDISALLCKSPESVFCCKDCIAAHEKG